MKNLFMSLLSCAALLLPTVAAAKQTMKEYNYTPDATTFTLFAPQNATVTLRLYAAGIGGDAVKTIAMDYDAGHDCWATTVEGDIKGTFYTFDVDAGNGSLGESAGIFALAVGVNGKRACVVNLDDTDPEGWENDQRPAIGTPADLIIYEMHHRDFSVSPTSGISVKGKFVSLADPKALAHLTDLGINAVHILPSFDYASVDESAPDTPQYNWGYDPLNYNVPEGSYSTDAADPLVRIREFKTMVQALHEAGIRVILDVVYNHTFDTDGSNFQRTYPDYYFRKNADGTPSNGSGCGNETASDMPAMRRFMIESVLYWIDEYHIDGFRFDLMGIHDIETMNAIRAAVDSVDPSIFIYGEGWSAGSCAYPAEKLAMKAAMKQMPGIAAFCDDMRDALRGPFSDDTQGAFLAGLPGSEESIRFGIVGAIDHPQIDMEKVNYSTAAWTDEPTQMISYVSCHDDMCLVDRLRTSIPGITDAELIRLDLLAQTAVLTSQGVPFILCGEEMLRDKKGVHNSYNSPDEINMLDWSNLAKYPQVFNYYKNLIALRKHHPAFRLASADKVRESVEFIETGDNMVAFIIKGNAGGDQWSNIVVALNAARIPQEVSVPDGTYTVVCSDGIVDEGGLYAVEGTQAVVGPQSALIMHM